MVSLIVAAAVLAADAPVTFNRDIAPIVWRRCASCHRPGEIAPFSLLTYADVKRHATQIGIVTAKRLMPPWKPVRGDFEGDRRLSDRELELIQRWIADGTPEGAAADRRAPPPPPPNQGWQLGAPDLVVRMPTPYTVRPEG